MDWRSLFQWNKIPKDSMPNTAEGLLSLARSECQEAQKIMSGPAEEVMTLSAHIEKIANAVDLLLKLTVPTSTKQALGQELDQLSVRLEDDYARYIGLQGFNMLLKQKDRLLVAVGTLRL